MEVTVTQFRKDMFSLMSKALEGETISMTYKGKRLRVVAEDAKPLSKLARLTPIQVVKPGVDLLKDEFLIAEMEREWEADWNAL